MSDFQHYNTEAARYIAGGVVSLNRKVNPAIVFERAKGSKLYDVAGKEYIDYHASFAPYLLGHNFDAVNEAVVQSIREERSLYGSGTNALEILLAKTMCELIPSLELIQVSNTGSEATAHESGIHRARRCGDDDWRLQRLAQRSVAVRDAVVGAGGQARQSWRISVCAAFGGYSRRNQTTGAFCEFQRH